MKAMHRWLAVTSMVMSSVVLVTACAAPTGRNNASNEKSSAAAKAKAAAALKVAADPAATGTLTTNDGRTFSARMTVDGSGNLGGTIAQVGGDGEQSNIAIPADSPPGTMVSNSDGTFSIADVSGNVVGKFTSGTYDSTNDVLTATIEAPDGSGMSFTFSGLAAAGLLTKGPSGTWDPGSTPQGVRPSAAVIGPVIAFCTANPWICLGIAALLTAAYLACLAAITIQQKNCTDAHKCPSGGNCGIGISSTSPYFTIGFSGVSCNPCPCK